MMPKLREAFTKHNQSIQPLIPLAGIPQKAVYTGALKNYDAHLNEIWSQNSMATTHRDSSDDEPDEAMEVATDDETVGDLNVSDVPQSSFRSRSTIL
jgi:hypothetical protein